MSLVVARRRRADINVIPLIDVMVVLVFFLVELFDATGTLMGVASRAGLLVNGRMERLNKALLADSCAAAPIATPWPMAPDNGADVAHLHSIAP